MVLNKSIAPTEGEISVKTYLCTYFNSFIFGIKANGYLEVTNKRLLFQALGSSITGTASVIHSEVPISEVVGINIYRGKPFSLLRLLGGLLLVLVCASLAGAIISLLLSSLQSSPIFYQVIIWVIFLGSVYLSYFHNKVASQEDDQQGQETKDNTLKELLIICVGLGAIARLASDVMSYDPLGSSKPAVPAALLTLVYALYRYSKRPAFTLLVHSKSGSNAIVRVTGTSPLGAANSAASKALSGKPAQDSLLVLKELGAVIFDIQNMGEYGINKWRINK